MPPRNRNHPEEGIGTALKAIATNSLRSSKISFDIGLSVSFLRSFVVPFLVGAIPNSYWVDYGWNRVCDDCSDAFTVASVFIQHKCKEESPKQEHIEHRRLLVETTLGVDITSLKTARRGRRIKSKAMGVLTDGSFPHLQDHGAPGAVVSNTLLPPCLGPAMSPQTLTLASANEPSRNNHQLSLWQEYGLLNWAQSPTQGSSWATQT